MAQVGIDDSSEESLKRDFVVGMEMIDERRSKEEVKLKTELRPLFDDVMNEEKATYWGILA